VIKKATEPSTPDILPHQQSHQVTKARSGIELFRQVWSAHPLAGWLAAAVGARATSIGSSAYGTHQLPYDGISAAAHGRAAKTSVRPPAPSGICDAGQAWRSYLVFARPVRGP
jgi:hypothetical protein